MSSFWKDKRVLVTGGAGFIGSFATEQLVEAGARVTVVCYSGKETPARLASVKDSITVLHKDLRRKEDCLDAVKGNSIVINMAARVAGVEFNSKHPATMLMENAVMDMNLLEAARETGVERFQVVSSACVYRRDCAIPTPETEGFIDHPEPSNFGYGWAKRITEVQAMAYAEEYGMKIGIVRPYNAYGPRDHFDPAISHVIAALIRRVYDGENPLKVWGSGEQTRAFLYVEDFARGVLEGAEKYPQADPVNLGTSEEVTIKELVRMILEISGKRPEVLFDTTKPAGQPRRNCDTRKAEEKIGFKAKFSLHEGLEKTIRWYEKNKAAQ